MPHPSYSTSPASNSTLDIPAFPPGVVVETLPNGLHIIVREDHSAPVVSAHAWCRTGSIHEGSWLGAGLSHVLEHMLFKGTTTRGKGRIDQEVQEAGGYMNAYTSFDRTVYYINVPNTGARTAIDILCDIMQNASLPEDELEQELDVIRREMDMCQDDPARRSSKRLFETAYAVSPYRFTIIGYPDIFNELKREDIAAYYRQRYAPNNVFFTVVGDLSASEAIAQIRQAFQSCKARPIPPWILPAEPRQTAPRDLIEEASIELAHAHVSWHIPDVRHPDVPWLDVIAVLLGSGRSSRLYQAVRERLRLVHSIDSWTYSPGGAGLFGVSWVADAHRTSDAQRAILDEVQQLRDAPVSESELAKAIKQFTVATLSARKTMQGQAQDLGNNWLAAGDLNFSQRYLEAVRQATPTGLQRVAQQYLTPENRTTYALVPTGTTASATALTESFVRSPVHKHTCANGLRLLIKEDHRLPFVEFRAVFQGGALAETISNNGVTQLMGRLLLKGTRRRSAEQIASEIESVGGSIESYGGNNSFGVNLEVLQTDFDIGLDLLADVILHPTFNGETVDREREIQLATIRAQKDQLLQRAFRLMRESLFQGVGYALDATGQEESVSQLNSQSIADFHQRFSVPRNAVLAVFGNVQTAQVQAAVENAFGSWTNTDHPKIQALSSFPAARQRIVERRDKSQAVLVLGMPSVNTFDPDRYPLDLMMEACSDLGSRLFMRIRDQLGLAYYVGAQNFAGLAPGYFAFYAGTSPEHVGRVEEELLKEIQQLREEGLTPQELQRAKAKVVGQRKIARQDLGGLALTTALDELYGLGYLHSETEDDRYAAVTIDQVREAAARHLDPNRSVLATLLPEDS